jgi:hypothetical protein
VQAERKRKRSVIATLPSTAKRFKTAQTVNATAGEAIQTKQNKIRHAREDGHPFVFP